MVKKIYGKLNQQLEAKYELQSDIGKLYRLIHFYESEEYIFPFSIVGLEACLNQSKTLVAQLKEILDLPDWSKIPELKKKMLLVLKTVEEYQHQLRNNQEEYELLLKIQRDYQNILLTLNLLYQNQLKNQEQYQNTKLQNQKVVTETDTYSPPFNPQPQLIFTPFTAEKKDDD